MPSVGHTTVAPGLVLKGTNPAGPIVAMVVPGTVDPSLRPNQILAVGGLPHALIDGEKAARIVATVEAALLTPLGLRSLAPSEILDDHRQFGSPSGSGRMRTLL